MNFINRSIAASAMTLVSLFGSLAATVAHADARVQLTADGERTFHKLEALEPRSNYFARNAKAILVFLSVLKAGFVLGGETGNGVLLVHGKSDGFYNLSGGSWGLQIAVKILAM